MNGVEKFRAAFTSAPGLTHLNNAGLSPISRPAAEVMHYWIERYRTEGMFCNDAYLEAVHEARRDLASFVGAEPQQIAFFQSVASAISQIAFQIGLKAEDEVLMWDQEYGSHLYPWQAACRKVGATLRLIPSAEDMATPVDRLIAAISPQTRIVAISWVQFQTGALCELQPLVMALADRSIKIVVDAFQGIGILPFHFAESGVDAVVGGSHKWMCSAVGVGYLCIRDEFAASLAPHNVGSYTYGTCDDPTDLSCQPKRDALRFEAGSKQVLEIVSLGAAARLLQSCGVELLSREALRLSQSLVEGLQAQGYRCLHSNGSAQRTPHVNFTATSQSPYQTLEEMEQALQAAQVSFARRGPGLRLSPHAHNRDADIERCLKVLARTGPIEQGEISLNYRNLY